jgi:hypothetical protein
MSTDKLIGLKYLGDVEYTTETKFVHFSREESLNEATQKAKS